MNTHFLSEIELKFCYNNIIKIVIQKGEKMTQDKCDCCGNLYPPQLLSLQKNNEIYCLDCEWRAEVTRKKWKEITPKNEGK